KTTASPVADMVRVWSAVESPPHKSNSDASAVAPSNFTQPAVSPSSTALAAAAPGQDQTPVASTGVVVTGDEKPPLESAQGEPVHRTSASTAYANSNSTDA